MAVQLIRPARVALLAAAFAAVPACLPDEDCRDTATCPPEPDASLVLRDAKVDTNPGDASADRSVSDSPTSRNDVANGPAERGDGAPLESDSGAVGCVTGTVRKCGDNPELHALGNCAAGTQTCIGTNWGPCNVKAQAKDACTPDDDANCNGTINDGCPCVDGAKQPCGPPADVGECRRGTQTCVASTWSDCVGAVLAKPRDCTSGLDVDCDGFPDNKVDAICKCTVGVQQECDTHTGKDGKGPCHPGSQTCVAAADKRSSAFSSCGGSAGPAAADTCEIGNDNNCNGIVNEGCSCVNGSTQACGPATAVGICKPGVQSCVGNAWGACTAVFATGRDCTKTIDNDCNGTPDQSDTTCECIAATTRACTTTLLGPCKPGTQTCDISTDKKSTKWGDCIGTVTKAAKDTCDPGNDANCSGIPNEGCACVNGTTRSCGTDAGNCVAGTQTCVNSAWSATCVGEVKPGARDCTRAGDNDCVNGEDQFETSCSTPCKLGATLTGCATVLPGSCARGTQTCVASANKTTVAWGPCVPPPAAATDGCNPPNDANCNGKVGEGCCAPKTTCASGQCGPVSNGCGGTIDCGTTCPGMGQSCGGGSTAGVCGCRDNGTACTGKVCGTVQNNCGATVTCQPNSCTARPETLVSCQNNQCVLGCRADTTPLSCSTSLSPACGRWTFEQDGAEAAVSIGLSMDTATAPRLASAAEAGSDSRVFAVTLAKGFSILSVPLCPAGDVISLKDKHASVRLKLQPVQTGDVPPSYVALNGMNGNISDFFSSIDNPPAGVWFTLEGDSTLPNFGSSSMAISVTAESPLTVFVDDLYVR